MGNDRDVQRELGLLRHGHPDNRGRGFRYDRLGQHTAVRIQVENALPSRGYGVLEWMLGGNVGDPAVVISSLDVRQRMPGIEPNQLQTPLRAQTRGLQRDYIIRKVDRDRYLDRIDARIAYRDPDVDVPGLGQRPDHPGRRYRDQIRVRGGVLHPRSRAGEHGFAPELELDHWNDGGGIEQAGKHEPVGLGRRLEPKVHYLFLDVLAGEGDAGERALVARGIDHQGVDQYQAVPGLGRLV